MDDMRPSLKEIENQNFDVVVIGGGINGASATQNLAASGYKTLLVEKKNYSSGASGHSSRLLHCGLRYLAPGNSLFDFIRQPKKLKIAFHMAKQAMQNRAQIVSTSSERVKPIKFGFPIWKDSQYKGWQVDLAFKILSSFDKGGVPLNYKRLDNKETKSTPLLKELRNMNDLKSTAIFDEYQFDWPDRICIDTILDAQRMCAHVRNYTSASNFKLKDNQEWQVTLTDEITRETVIINAKLVINTAGIWIDQVAQKVKNKSPSRRILGTKGTHIMVQLPRECNDYGIATLNRVHEPFYCVPWRGLHYFGPTETIYDGDLDDIRPTENEIEWLIDEANYLLPSLNLNRDKILYSWSGVRPLTYDPNFPKGKRNREIHDYESDGMPNFLAMTAGPIMTHRSAGVELRDAVAQRIEPSQPTKKPSFKGITMPIDNKEEPILPDWDQVRISDINQMIENEQIVTLKDLMFHHAGLAWTETMGFDSVEQIAQLMGNKLGWNHERLTAEISRYRDYLKKYHTYNLHKNNNHKKTTLN